MSTVLRLIIFGTLIQGFSTVFADLIFEPQDLAVVVGESEKFSVRSSESIKDVAVHFDVNFSDIVKVDPSDIVIPSNNTETKWEVNVHGLLAGHTLVIGEINRKDIDVAQAFIRVTALNSHAVSVLSTVVGWIYFVAWSISFYPQFYENWRRKSVVGLNFDFLYLNLMGFVLYSLFNCGLYWIPLVQSQFFERHERSPIPVQPNDIFFSVHACIISVATIFQCFIYERGEQRISTTARVIMGIFGAFVTVTLLCSIFNVLLWLDFLYFCSYIKLTITLIKYIPQAYMNFRRKSTIGWSIWTILLDLTGGIFSMLQMCLNSYNYNDWQSIFTDPTKFGLGLFSAFFDLFFIVQHYILYRNLQPYQALDGQNFAELDPETSRISTIKSCADPEDK